MDTSTYPTRPVQTYSMITKNVKKRRALPRSRSNTTTRRDMPHMSIMGASMRGRGRSSGPALMADAESISRFSAR